MLKYQLKKVIDCFDLDRLITETYGKPYCFQQQDGCQSRGTYYLSVPSEEGDDDYYPETIPFKINGSVMGVKFETWLNTSVEDVNEKYPEDYPGANRLFWDRNFYPKLGVVVNDLYKKGLIEAGEYTIDIDW